MSSFGVRCDLSRADDVVSVMTILEVAGECGARWCHLQGLKFPEGKF